MVVVLALAALGLLAAPTLLTGCQVDPAALAPSPGAPCGVVGVVCLAPDGHRSGMCCPENTTCGGPFPSVGCPDGECCPIGTLVDGARVRQRATP